MLARLFNSTAIRMALRYSLIYALILIGVALIYYLSLQTPVRNNVRSTLFSERTITSAIYKEHGIGGVIGYINQQNSIGRKLIYFLSNAQGEKLAGNLLQVSEEIKGVIKNSEKELGEVIYIYFEEQSLPKSLFNDDAHLPTTIKTFHDNSILIIAHHTPRSHILKELTEYLVEFAIPVILLSLIIGITLGLAILQRLNTIGQTAKKIMQGDITQRIPLSSKNDEFDALSNQLNTMMDRIQQLIESIRQVSDNVAHDLRSPLTRLRNNLEVTLLDERSSEEYKKTLRAGIQDAEALLKTFNSLLSITNAESGNHRSQWKQVALNALLIDLVELYEPLAAEKNQQITYIDSTLVNIIASRDLLAQAFSNLIENAIKFTPDSGKIVVELKTNQEIISVSFTDSGSGIPEGEQERVLERFVRLDNSRNTPGNGLGLSLVKAVSELHRGTVNFRNANPGLIVTIKLKNYSFT